MHLQELNASRSVISIEQDGVRQDRIARQSLPQKKTSSYHWSSCPQLNVYNDIIYSKNRVKYSIVQKRHNKNTIYSKHFRQCQLSKYFILATQTRRSTSILTNTWSDTTCTACQGNLSFLGTQFKPCIAPLQHKKMVKYITRPPPTHLAY